MIHPFKYLQICLTFGTCFSLQTPKTVVNSTANDIEIENIHNHWNLRRGVKWFSKIIDPKSIVAKDAADYLEVSYNKAFQQSFGFFYDVPESDWDKSLEIAYVQQAIQDKQFADPMDRAPQFYQKNFEPEFSCRMQQRVGRAGDGGKWVCDPHRIEKLSEFRKMRDGKQDPCLVYSVGSNGDHSFEHGVMDLFGEDFCEIHTFEVRSAKEVNERDQTDEQKRKTKKIHLHHNWGLLSSEEPAKLGFKTLAQTINTLNHEGRTIDIFKIDCDGCEWTTFQDWYDDSTPALLQQILVEVHGNPPVSLRFFEGMKNNGYFIFNKEPNIQYGGGKSVEFSYLKLDPTAHVDNTN